MNGISIQQVRDYLNKLAVELVPDETISANLHLAEIIVDNEKSSQASADLVREAKLAIAGYYAYIAYASDMERGMGDLPAPVLAHLTLLKEVADKLLAYAKRGNPDIAAPVGLTTSHYEAEDNVY